MTTPPFTCTCMGWKTPSDSPLSSSSPIHLKALFKWLSALTKRSWPTRPSTRPRTMVVWPTSQMVGSPTSLGGIPTTALNSLASSGNKMVPESNLGVPDHSKTGWMLTLVIMYGGTKLHSTTIWGIRDRRRWFWVPPKTWYATIVGSQAMFRSFVRRVWPGIEVQVHVAGQAGSHVGMGRPMLFWTWWKIMVFRWQRICQICCFWAPPPLKTSSANLSRIVITRFSLMNLLSIMMELPVWQKTDVGQLSVFEWQRSLA